MCELQGGRAPPGFARDTRRHGDVLRAGGDPMAQLRVEGVDEAGLRGPPALG